ncbi:MAG: hypothetical protein GMKNLPBB_01592 [Myxococcota bacterium]|nr:hypothetical protein [Myxococcota bacterium]
MLRCLLLAILAASAWPPTGAWASTADVFGLGARLPAMANVGVAWSSGGESGWYNPAGMGLLEGRQLSAGLSVSGTSIETGGVSNPLRDPIGLYFSAASDIPFGGVMKRRLFVGFYFHLPTSNIVTVRTVRPADPHDPLYENRSQRMIVLPSLAVRITDWLHIGAGFNFFATLEGRIVATEGTTRAVEPLVNEDFFGNLGLVLSLTLRPIEPLRIALAFRDEFSVKFRNFADVNIAGTLIRLNLNSESNYTPMQFTLGAGFQAASNLKLAADLTFEKWSGHSGNFTTVESEVPALFGRLAPALPVKPFDNVFTGGVSAEYVLETGAGHEIPLRAGYHYRPSPAPLQDGVTNLGSSGRHIAGLGAGWISPDLGGVRMVVNLGSQLHALPRTTVKKDPAKLGLSPDAGKDAAANPGWPELSSGGYAWNLSGDVGLRF